MATMPGAAAAVAATTAATATERRPSLPPPVPLPALAAVRDQRNGGRWALLAAALVGAAVLAWLAVQDQPPPPIPAEAMPAAAMAPASPASPGPTAGLPAGAMARVILTYPRGTAGAARAGEVAAALERAGLAVGALFPVTQAAGVPRLSYFFREDREAALRVLGNAGSALEQAVLRLGPLEGAMPRPGAIELALPDAASGTDAAARATDAPGPVPAVLAAPADGAVLPMEAALRGITLSWQSAVAEPECCFVEVIRLDGGEPLRAVFAAYATTEGEQLLQLSRPGRYAWRVLTVSLAAQRYSPSPWRYFVLGEPQP